MRTYRISALASALVRMWRGWSVIVPVVVVNAVVQALLVAGEFTLDQGWLLVLSAIVSALVFAAAYGVVASTALQVPDGRVGWPAAWARLRQRLLRYALWSLALLALLVATLLVNGLLALVMIVVTVFVPFAALDDRGPTVSVAIRTIGRRFWRWLLTAVIAAVGIGLGVVISGFTAFFLRGALASFAVWTVGGLLLAWLATAWALIYRSAWEEPSESVAPEPDSAPDLEPA